MRAAVFLLLIAIAVAEYADETWMEEEDVDASYGEEVVYRRRREVYDDPYEEYIRVKRCEQPRRVRRSEEYVRRPRQVHQYEVHESTDEIFNPSSPPYEEMLAASAEHYHKVYAAPGPTARYLRPEASPVSNVPVSTQPFKLVPDKPVALPIVSSPVQYIANPGLSVGAPLPVASVPLSQPLQQLSDGDLFGAAAGHHHKQAHGHAQGGGQGKHAHHFADHGAKSSKGFHQNHHVDKGGKGYKTDEKHRKEYEEAEGKKRKHHDNAGHKGSHEEEAHGHRGAHFDEKKGHKKGHKTKGYHNKYHKDEFHKEHKFYDDFHKSGEHHRYGKFNAKHASNESGKKKAHHVNAGHDYVERGKKGYSNKGHLDSDHKGHNGKHGHEEHHAHHSDHGKKGGSEGGSQWGYAKKQ